MSKWDSFKKNLESFADKTVNKTKELTDTASLKIRIANKEADRDLEYKKLGKYAYIKLKKLDGYNTSEITEEISRILENIDSILVELNELKAEDNERKAAKDAEKAAKAAKKEKSEDELDMNVMNEFNEARKVADAEYEKAKQSVFDADQAVKDADIAAKEAEKAAEEAKVVSDGLAKASNNVHDEGEKEV